MVFITIVSLSASAEATLIDECVEQPIYGENCTIFNDEDCTELGRRYPVACEFLCYSARLLIYILGR